MAGLFTSPGRRWHLASWRGDQDDFQSIIGSKRQYFPLASFSGASACKTGSERRTIKTRRVTLSDRAPARGVPRLTTRAVAPEGAVAPDDSTGRRSGAD